MLRHELETRLCRISATSKLCTNIVADARSLNVLRELYFCLGQVMLLVPVLLW